MTDVDYDDWYDDDPTPAKEEPDCYACGDWRSGCRECSPTQIQQLWWRLTWRLREAWRRLVWRVRARANGDEVPF